MHASFQAWFNISRTSSLSAVQSCVGFTDGDEPGREPVLHKSTDDKPNNKKSNKNASKETVASNIAQVYRINLNVTTYSRIYELF